MATIKVVAVLGALGVAMTGCPALAQNPPAAHAAVTAPQPTPANKNTKLDSSSPQAQPGKSPQQDYPDQINKLLNTIKAAQSKFLDDQKALQDKLRRAKDAQREKIRAEMQDKRDAFLEQQKEMREEFRQRVAELKQQLRDLSDVIDAAKEQAKDHATRKGGDN
jgi:Skp family chaperone for outer membrane proteins